MSSPAVENKASSDAKPQRDQQKKEFRRKNGASSPSIEKGNDKANGQQNSPQNGRNHAKKQPNTKDGEKKSSVNERFDNSSLLAAEGDSTQDPAFSLKVSESKRMNDIVPPGLAPEVLAKVKGIQAVLPNFEFHHIYTVLERCRFDQEEAINMLVETRKPADAQKQHPKGKQQTQQQQQQQQPKAALKDQLAQTPWANVVKGPQQQSPPEQVHHVQQQQQQPQHQPVPQQQQHQQQQPPQHQQQHQQAQHQIPQHQQQVLHQQQQQQQLYANPLLQGMMPVLGGISNPEEVVLTLSSAISEQLALITQKSNQLMAMQEELKKITSTDKSEMQQLVDRKAHLQDEQRRLHEQLRQNEANLLQIEEQISAKGREKAVALQSLTAKSAELGVVEMNPRYQQPPQQVQQYAQPQPQVYLEQPQHQQEQVDAQYQQYNNQQNGQQRNKGGNRNYNNGNGNYQQQQPYRGGRQQQGNRY